MKKSKSWSQTTGICFVRMDSDGLTGDFHSRSTQVTIHLSTANQPGIDLISLRLYEVWCTGCMEIIWRKKTTDQGEHWWFYQKNLSRKCAMAQVPVNTVCVLP